MICQVFSVSSKIVYGDVRLLFHELYVYRDILLLKPSVPARNPTMHMTFIAEANWRKFQRTDRRRVASFDDKATRSLCFTIFIALQSSVCACLPTIPWLVSHLHWCAAPLYQLQPPLHAVSVERYWTTCWNYRHRVFHKLYVIQIVSCKYCVLVFLGHTS
jgi:hypothetical protein